MDNYISYKLKNILKSNDRDKEKKNASKQGILFGVFNFVGFSKFDITKYLEEDFDLKKTNYLRSLEFSNKKKDKINKFENENNKEISNYNIKYSESSSYRSNIKYDKRFDKENKFFGKRDKPKSFDKIFNKRIHLSKNSYNPSIIFSAKMSPSYPFGVLKKNQIKLSPIEKKKNFRILCGKKNTAPKIFSSKKTAIFIKKYSLFKHEDSKVKSKINKNFFLKKQFNFC